MNFKTVIFKSVFAVFFLITTAQLSAQSFFNSFDRSQGLGQGVGEISGIFAHQVFSYDGETESSSNSYGLRTGYGLGDEFDIKFSWISQNSTYDFLDDLKVNYFVFTPKYSIGDGKLAFAVPIGIVTSKYGEGDREHETYVTPQVLFNYPFSDIIEAGINARYIIPFVEDTDNLIGIDVGVGISGDLSQWVVRPELGLVFNPGEEGIFLSPGVSFSYFVGGW